MRQRRTGFTMVEILVSIAILAILFGLLFRPLLMAMEVLSIGRSERRAQDQSRMLIDRLSEDLQAAIAVYPNLATFQLGSTRWRTPQTARLDIVPPARDGNGNLVVPVRPAYVNNDPTQPLVISYWLMREDPDVEYHPETNPRMVWRALHSYLVPSRLNPSDPNEPVPPSSPDDLWRYSLAVSRWRSLPLSALRDEVSWLFGVDGSATGVPGCLDWFVTDIERASPADPSQVMRAPRADAGYSHAANIAAVTAVTDRQTDVRELRFLPVRADNEELKLNDNATAYKGERARWVQPYQRSVDGQWVLPANGLIGRADGRPAHPLVALFRSAGTRDGAGPLGEQYFITVVQDAADPLVGGRVGHPVLYRLQQNANSENPVPVYDLTDYPKRVFWNPPGSDENSNLWSGEMACGINWETGEITTAFPQTDVICPAPPGGGGTEHAIIALNNYTPGAPISAPPVYQAGDSSPSAEWQSLPLTWHTNPGGEMDFNGSMLDDYVVDQAAGTSGVWDSYTLSVMRPRRLRTDRATFTDAALTADYTGGDPVAAARLAITRRRLNMSIVPGSVKVEVVRCRAPNAAAVDPTDPTQVVGRYTYTPVRALTPGAVDAGALAPFRFHIDVQTGRLTFYDPQLDEDATTERDGLNPPAVVPDGQGGYFFPVIYVTYEYRNNLPTQEQLMLGNDANRDIVVATYRSLEAIELRLRIDVPTESTRGAGETVADPDNPANPDPLAAQPIERPTGARRRVDVTTILEVGTRR